MMTFAKGHQAKGEKSEKRNTNEENIFFRKYTRKESRFVSVSHFRYLHYYRVNISTAILHKSSLFLQYLQGAPTKMGQEKLHNK